MNRTTGMLGLFAAGVAVGVIGTRWLDGDTEVQLPAAEAIAAPGPVTASPGGSVVASANSPVLGVQAPAVSTSQPQPVPPPGNPSPAAPGATPSVAVSSPYATPIDSGSVQAIDVGERLRKHIDRPSQPGHENEIGDAHRALEREPRDDSWAYTMEAELQNSMLAEVSTGGFTVDGVECRSTLCEVRISGAAAQSSAVKRWNDSLMAQPLGQRLLLNYGSTFSDNERVDGIFIFRRPKKP